MANEYPTDEQAAVAPTGDTGAHDRARLNSDYWLQHRDKLFLASCIALIVTAMSFAVRGDALITALTTQFKLNNAQSALIIGTAFWGFTLSQVIGGPLCDVIGMGRLLILAFIGHAIGIVMTILANDFTTFFFSTLAFGLANGFVEAACNPLIATLYPDQKIKKLNQFHVWFPGGIVIGSVVSYLITHFKIGGDGGYKIAMATMVVPLIVYAIMFIGKKFPATERAASGVTMGQMFTACLNPLFLLFVVCMLLTAATELGTTTWLPNILTRTTGTEGIVYVGWIFGLMALGRMFAGTFVHRVSPVAVLIGSSLFSIVGLYFISTATAAASAFLGATVFAIGVCFFWPTMLGVVSERFPKTGALGLGIMGGAGMLSVSIILPVIGRTYDSATNLAAGGKEAAEALKTAATADGAATSVKGQWLTAQAAGGQQALQAIVYMPIILAVIFTAIYLYDKSRGGYKEEILVQHHDVAEEVSA